MDGADHSFLLGTDQLGRDQLSRLIWGARTSLLVGVGSVLIAGAIGIPIGLVAGYAGRWVDDVLMRLMDIQLAFPAIFLTIAIMAVIGQGLFNVVVVLGLVNCVQYARIVRASTLSLKEQEFVLAARVTGATAARILRRHVLPNGLAPIVAIATVNVSAMILAEAGLSFLGLGVQPPTPAWGSMLAESRDYWTLAWWSAVYPGMAILLTVLGVNLLSDSLGRRA
jgi:peptide/nickel transport system permease protein